MSPKLIRQFYNGGFIERSIDVISPDQWRPHGIRYRFAWVLNEKRRVLFDNHHGKADHIHIDGEEKSYEFVNIEQLLEDFYLEIEDWIRKNEGKKI